MCVNTVVQRRSVLQTSVADGVQRLNAGNTESASLSSGPKFGKYTAFVHVPRLRLFEIFVDEVEYRALVG